MNLELEFGLRYFGGDIPCLIKWSLRQKNLKGLREFDIDYAEGVFCCHW